MFSYPFETSDEWIKDQVEESLQKQLEMIQQLHSDPVPIVRAQAVHMTGHVLSTFFDFIPIRVCQILASTLISTLSKDKSSVDVRCAVMQAISKILENPLSHPLLKQLLPELSHSIHDTSERVRACFLKVLLSAKSIKGLKFHNIVDIDHLLAQLEVEKNSKINKQMTELLLDTYFPYGEKTSKQLIRRCCHLVRTNPTAAQKFYMMVAKLVCIPVKLKFIHPKAPPGPVTKFITRLWTNCLSNWIITRKAAKDMGDEYNDENEEFPNGKKQLTSSYIPHSDLHSVSAIFHIIVMCWERIHPELKAQDNEPLRSVNRIGI